MSEQIGADIRALRKSRGLTLTALAQTINRSAGWLSLIERGIATASVRDLELIAREFGLTLSFFFRASGRDSEEQGIVQRAADRMSIGSPETGLVEELLSPTLSGAFEMIRSTFAPRSQSDGLKPAHPKEDAGVLITGQLTLIIGDLTVELTAGDSFHFQDKPYGWRNDHDTPAEVIWVVSPPVY